MNKKSKALEYYDYLVKTNPNKSVELKFFIRVYDNNCVEASNQPFILDSECIYSLAEYVLISGSGFKTKIENIQLYFNNEGDTFEYAPYKDGQLKIDLRQAWAGYSGEGYYDCYYKYKGLTLKFNGCPGIDFPTFYKLFLSYADIVVSCSSQKEVDYLQKCLEKDLKISEIMKDNLAKAIKISCLEDELEAHKGLLEHIKELVSNKDN